MPRNGKRKHRLTKREIKNMKFLANRQQEDVARDPKAFRVSDEIKIPDRLFTYQAENTHYRIFENFNPTVDVIRLNEEAIAFKSESDRDLYREWHTRYLEKFGENTSFDLPPPSDDHYPYMENVYRQEKSSGLTTTARRTKNSARADEETDKWIWCLENCEEEVRYAGSHFYFKSKEDATLYRITFG